MCPVRRKPLYLSICSSLIQFKLSRDLKITAGQPWQPPAVLSGTACSWESSQCTVCVFRILPHGYSSVRADTFLKWKKEKKKKKTCDLIWTFVFISFEAISENSLTLFMTGLYLMQVFWNATSLNSNILHGWLTLSPLSSFLQSQRRWSMLREYRRRSLSSHR